MKKETSSNISKINSPYLIQGFLNSSIIYDSFYSLDNFVPVYDENGKVQIIGSGSYGQVYLALHILNKKYYAIKHMDKKSQQYQMSGGDVVSNWASNALKSARNGVKKVDIVPEVPKLEKDTSLDVDDSTKETTVGGIDVNIRMEGKSFEDNIRKLIQ
jgi:serine/threonine protein kinase